MEKIYGTSVRQDGLQRVGQNRWDLFFGFGADEENGVGYNWRKTFGHKPSKEEVKEAIYGVIREKTRQSIIENYRWNNAQVWLSPENQANYTRAYELALNGKAPLPMVKLGTDDEPVFHEFLDLQEMTDFITGMQQHIQSSLEEGWRERANIDWSLFE